MTCKLLLKDASYLDNEMMPLRNKQLPDSIMNKMYSSMPYSMIQCEYTQPMRDNVTM